MVTFPASARTRCPGFAIPVLRRATPGNDAAMWVVGVEEDVNHLEPAPPQPRRRQPNARRSRWCEKLPGVRPSRSRPPRYRPRSHRPGVRETMLGMDPEKPAVHRAAGNEIRDEPVTDRTAEERLGQHLSDSVDVGRPVVTNGSWLGWVARHRYSLSLPLYGGVGSRRRRRSRDSGVGTEPDSRYTCGRAWRRINAPHHPGHRNDHIGQWEDPPATPNQSRPRGEHVELGEVRQDRAQREARQRGCDDAPPRVLVGRVHQEEADHPRLR